MDPREDMHAPTSSQGLSRVPLTSMSQGAEGKLELSSDTGPASSPEEQRAKDWLSLLVALTVWLCTSMCAVANYLTETISEQAFKVEIVALGIAGLLACFQALAITYLRSDKSLRKCRLCLLVVSVLLYGVADERFAAHILGKEYSGNGVSAFLPATALLFACSSLLRYRPLSHLLTSLLCGVCTLGFLLPGAQRASSLAEFGVFMAMQLWYSYHLRRMRKHRKTTVQEVLEWTGAEGLESWESPEEALSTERELLLKQLQDTYELLTELMPMLGLPVGRDKLKDALKRLKATGRSLQTTENINKVHIGFVSSQVDSEYRCFLEQNYFPVAVVAHTQKPRSRKSLEVAPLHDLKPLGGQLIKVWNFDMLQLCEESGGRPLELVGAYMLRKYGLVSGLRLEEGKCEQSLRDLEQRYLPNPYHNATHAAEVAHSLLFLYDQSVLLQVTTEVELFASIVAALAHDVGHPGFNNRYLINTRSSFARICKIHTDNDFSVLEMMHTALAFEILDNVHLLEPLTWENWVLFRKVVVDLILATDMMRHFELLNTFKARFAGKEPVWDDFDDRLSLYRLCIKCADVGHAAKCTALHESWTWKVVEEFFHQGDLERTQHMPISAFCDRNNADVPGSQAGFLLNIVRPMFEAVNVVLRSEGVTVHCLDQLTENVRFWEHKRKTARSHTQQPIEPEASASQQRLPPFSERKTVMN